MDVTKTRFALISDSRITLTSRSRLGLGIIRLIYDPGTPAIGVIIDKVDTFQQYNAQTHRALTDY